MILAFELAGGSWQIDTDAAHDISIPLHFNGPQPRAFGIDAAISRPVEAGGFVGDTRRGGACNCETVTLNPHGNGTHTECLGHVVDERVAVAAVLREPFLPAVVASVTPLNAGNGDKALEGAAVGDRVITRRALVNALEALGSVPREFFSALVLRTLPNDESRLNAAYSGTNPAYLTPAAMRLIRELGVRHLLLDLPSVDREEDDGRLAAHRIFWDLPAEGHLGPEPLEARTITEMIFVGNHIADGCYMLNLQIPHFMLDAAPSRPLLFGLIRRK
ncbi:MAG TPA: cyclase family protein [Candidatus Kapabacteria bacterium]|nr:cyclase family protein [Candidatus Kapabacteria bacterium]